MREVLSVRLRMIMGACAQARQLLPEGSAERKNLLIAQRLAARTLLDVIEVPAAMRDVSARLSAIATRSRLGDLENAKIEMIERALNGSADVDAVLAVLRQAADAFGQIGGEQGTRLSRACLDIEADFYRRLEALYRTEMAQFASQDVGTDNDIDTQRLAAYLSDLCNGAPITINDVKVVPGGFSKSTLIVSLGESAHFSKSIVLRVDRALGFLGTTVKDEFGILKRLHEHGSRVPKPFACESTGSVLGTAFMVVETLPGKSIGDMFNLPPANPRINAAIGRELARLHRIPLEAVQDVLKGIDKKPREQAAEWLAQSRESWERLNAPCATMDAAFAWLADNLHLADGDPVVMHGDFGLNNILIDGETVSGLLDWEFVCAGHAGYDLGYFHCMAEALGGWEDFLKNYQEAGGVLPSPDVLGFFILFANVRLAVMVWQATVGFDRGELPMLIFSNPASNDLRVATLRVYEQLKAVAP